jgi:hypothetical protein
MEEQILAFVKSLEEFHGKALTAEARVYYVDALGRAPVGLVREAVSRWRTANSPSARFPSVAQIKAHIQDARTAQWQAGKRHEDKAPLLHAAGGDAEDPEYNQARWELVKRAHGMTKQQLVGAFEEIHRRYPGHDWDGAATRLRTKISLQPEGR